MANIGILNPTITDVAKRLDPNGKVDKIVEMLMQTNEILKTWLLLKATCLPDIKPIICSGLPEAGLAYA